MKLIPISLAAIGLCLSIGGVASAQVVQVAPVVQTAPTLDPNCANGTTTMVAPPAPISETITISPSARHVWMKGHWAWNGSRHQWVAGRWQLPPHVGQVWVPARWERNHNRFVFVAGHWDLPHGHKFWR